VSLKHATLPLTGETVEEQKQEKQQYPGPLGASLFSVDIGVEGQFIGGRHEHGDSNPDENRDKVVILGICFGAKGASSYYEQG
jgi:hypothetical protein